MWSLIFPSDLKYVFYSLYKTIARPPVFDAAQINSQHVRVAAVKPDPQSGGFFLLLVAVLQDGWRKTSCGRQISILSNTPPAIRTVSLHCWAEGFQQSNSITLTHLHIHAFIYTNDSLYTGDGTPEGAVFKEVDNVTRAACYQFLDFVLFCVTFLQYILQHVPGGWS